MASTPTVQNLIDYARTYVKLAPIVSVGGFTNEPALRIANRIKNRIICQRFNWDWNRARIDDFLTVDGQDEYDVISGPANVGWLEKAYCERESDTTTPKTIRYLDIKRNIIKADSKGDPVSIGVDWCETIPKVGVRFNPMPSNTIWRVYIDYQKLPARLTALSNTFSPIPDEFEDVLCQYWIGFIYEFVDKTTAWQKLRDADRMLLDMAGWSAMEEEENGFVPERGLFLG